MSHPERHSQQRPHRSRLLALPFVVLSTMVYLGSAAHFALVQHSTCLEHGETIHVDGDVVRTQPQRVGASFTDERLTQSSQGGTVSHGAEAHCAHTFLRRESLPPASASLIAPEAPAGSSPVPWLEQLPLEPVARLRLAPKSSPPLS